VQALALIAIYGETCTGRVVLKDFDLAAANSGGAIVLGGLVEDAPLAELLQVFLDDKSRQNIFPPTHDFTDNLIRAVTSIPPLPALGPQYSTSAKLPALEKLMPICGPKPLPKAVAGIRRPGSDKDIHLLLTSFDYDRERAHFFRSAMAGGWGWGEGAPTEATLAQAIHASADPPINYFDQPAAVGGDRFWDGAIAGCNNPVLAAVTEARVLTDGATDIIALSIGAGKVALAGPPAENPPTPYVKRRTKQGLVTDIEKIAVSIVDDPPDVATFLAHVMTGGLRGLPDPLQADGPRGLPYPLQSRIVRMSPLVRPVTQDGRWMAPGGLTSEEFGRLAGLGIDAIQRKEVALIERYAKLWLGNLAPNQPIRMNGDTFECEVGHEWFGDALAAWRQLCAAFP
jgi:hypothetical protein